MNFPKAEVLGVRCGMLRNELPHLGKQSIREPPTTPGCNFRALNPNSDEFPFESGRQAASRLLYPN